MPRNQTSGNLAFASYDDIFNVGRNNVDGECIEMIPLYELYPPEFHPFLVRDDEAMQNLVESISSHGVLVPALARPRAEGGFELVAGNRRKRACELSGRKTMPVLVRDMDDDEAAIIIADTNLQQREILLPSEKAWAYRLKLEALNHRGSKSDTPGQLSVEILCEQTGDSRNTVFRLVRLTESVPDLSDRVDAKKLAFTPAVELSYLTRSEQAAVVDCMMRYEVRPSLSQAQRMKKASQENVLTPQIIESILIEPKKTTDGAGDPVASYKRFFPKDFTPEQMDAVIIRLLTKWKKDVSGNS